MSYEVKKGRIFVFGSNTMGRHGAGTARLAVQKYGAVYGVSCGLRGMSYALPTKYEEQSTRNLLSMDLKSIKRFVDKFLSVATQLSEFEFHVVKIGCGLAGYKDEEIAPMFTGAPSNCYFHPDWKSYGLKSYDEV